MLNTKISSIIYLQGEGTNHLLNCSPSLYK
nr:MAG TPA: hypothetical protein [Caudoviricetes sp.]